MPGKVYLVGAGPGDPELITVKARRLLASANCVLYDNLASHTLVDFAPADAEKIYVGKKKSLHTFTQEAICDMLVLRARAGLTVVRLKGGDPYLFGRGGEEAEALFDAGVAFEVVPGVTSALGLAAYSGIPLTHREHSSAVTFVTGHDPAHIDWTRTGLTETLVILMGLTTFPGNRQTPHRRRPVNRYARRRRPLGYASRSGNAPWNLGHPARHDLYQARNLKPPATIIVGKVAQLSH